MLTFFKTLSQILTGDNKKNLDRQDLGRTGEFLKENSSRASASAIVISCGYLITAACKAAFAETKQQRAMNEHNPHFKHSNASKRGGRR